MNVGIAICHQRDWPNESGGGKCGLLGCEVLKNGASNAPAGARLAGTRREYGKGCWLRRWRFSYKEFRVGERTLANGWVTEWGRALELWNLSGASVQELRVGARGVEGAGREVLPEWGEGERG